STVYAAQRRLFDNVATLDRLEIEESVLHIFERLMFARAGDGRHRDSVEEVKRVVAAAPQKNISLRQLARSAECSPYELCRRFRRETGMTITQFRHSLRLRTALELLRAHSDITAIALDLGYASHSHFTAAFRRCFGLTPSQFRAKTL
ncbi:MAG TPA: helix-turn-helix transcriptional regulator, partial [Thermoanaerobaculia bacterium]|nr:helix-turn-helix transcriptional regulator [Thermoanaerobaculia bacterium]